MYRSYTNLLMDEQVLGENFNLAEEKEREHTNLFFLSFEAMLGSNAQVN